MNDKNPTPQQNQIANVERKSLNPFEGEKTNRVVGASGAAEVQRAVAEVQAAIMLAKQFPRDRFSVTDKILSDCCRESLAEAAIYSYPKGGQTVTGVSIRLAEVLAQNWGNFDFGWDAINSNDIVTEIKTWAWDQETNVKRSTTFFVKHWRDTKGGGYALRDQRDIYELCANQAARRMRACILNVLPGDLIEAAVKQCETTLITKEAITPDKIKALIAAFESYGVSKGQIEKRIGRKIEAINGAVMLQLRKIFNGMKDGMSVASDFFEPDLEALPPAAPVKSPAKEVEPPAPPSEWDAVADDLIAGVNNCKSAKEIALFLEENENLIKPMNDAKAAKKWSDALIRKQSEFRSKNV